MPVRRLILLSLATFLSARAQEDANRALSDMKHSRTDGTPVVVIGA